MSFIQTQPVPARSSFIKVEVNAELGEGMCDVFEPNPCSLEAYELGALESILQVHEQPRKNVCSCFELSPERCVHG